MNHSLVRIAYGNVSIMAANTTVLWYLPLHGAAAIGRAITGTCLFVATGLLWGAAHRIERAEKATDR